MERYKPSATLLSDFDDGSHLFKKESRSTKKEHKLLAQIDKLTSYSGFESIDVSGSILKELPPMIHLPVATFIKVMDMSKAAYYRAKGMPSLPLDVVNKLSSLLKIYEKGIEAFEGLEDFDKWLHGSIPNLAGARPIELLKTEIGRSVVSEAIDRVEYGIYG